MAEGPAPDVIGKQVGKLFHHLLWQISPDTFVYWKKPHLQPTGNKNANFDNVKQILISQRVLQSSKWKLEDG
jgi:hypothetical protein